MDGGDTRLIADDTAGKVVLGTDNSIVGQDRELTTEDPQNMADVIGINTSPVEKTAGRAGLPIGCKD